MSSKIESR